MKRLMNFLLAVGILVAFSVRASADLAKGLNLYSAGKYAEAEAELQKNLPTLEGSAVAEAHHYIGMCLAAQGKTAEAIVELRKATDAKDAGGKILGASYLNIAGGLEAQARELTSQNNMVKAQEKLLEAQNEYLKVCVKGIPVGYIQMAFDNLDVTIIGKDKYVDYLNKILLVIPTKVENAEFLGQVKSEIEKLK